MLAQRIGRPDSFSYPNGNFNNDVKKTAQKYYGYAVSTEYGYNDNHTDLFELRRIGVNNNFSFAYFVLSLHPEIKRLFSKFAAWFAGNWY